MVLESVGQDVPGEEIHSLSSHISKEVFCNDTAFFDIKNLKTTFSKNFSVTMELLE